MDQVVARDLKRILSDQPGIKAAFLFGSASTGEMRIDSDIDVAVWMEEPLDSQEAIELINKISATCLRPVDLIDLRQTDPILLKEILGSGVPVVTPPDDVLENLLQIVVRNEADFLPLLRVARRERVEAFASER